MAFLNKISLRGLSSTDSIQTYDIYPQNARECKRKIDVSKK
jgi:hypothetical protein